MFCVVICGVDIGLSGQAWRCLDVASVAIQLGLYLGVAAWTTQQQNRQQTALAAWQALSSRIAHSLS
jgi:hypothetical protein